MVQELVNINERRKVNILQSIRNHRSNNQFHRSQRTVNIAKKTSRDRLCIPQTCRAPSQTWRGKRLINMTVSNPHVSLPSNGRGLIPRRVITSWAPLYTLHWAWCLQQFHSNSKLSKFVTQFQRIELQTSFETRCSIALSLHWKKKSFFLFYCILYN